MCVVVQCSAALCSFGIRFVCTLPQDVAAVYTAQRDAVGIDRLPGVHRSRLVNKLLTRAVNTDSVYQPLPATLTGCGPRPSRIRNILADEILTDAEWVIIARRTPISAPTSQR